MRGLGKWVNVDLQVDKNYCWGKGWDKVRAKFYGVIYIQSH
jgi:hypothetical protein